ncbi:MAG: peptidase T [Christensenellales bacterium]
METALERFLRYVKIDTTSDEASGVTPSSEGQWNLAMMLRDEMAALGLKHVLLDEHCYVYGLIPANKQGQPTIALIAHLDTVAAVLGRAFSPCVKRYEGKPLVLNEALGIYLSEADFPALAKYRGQELIVTDGTTVLGADDKAGIAEIMTLTAELMADRAFPHGDIWLVFTPDEEIGSGAELLDLARINADFGYTVDGGEVHTISYETFNAASAQVHIKGRNIHPGSAKGKMKNAATIAMRFHSLLPEKEIPEETEGYEGFYHLNHITGEEEEASLAYILRDHDGEKLEEKKRRMRWAAEQINERFGPGTATVILKDSYRNMGEIISQHPHVIKRAQNAIAACGMEPEILPIRGGTDGARLSFRGLPCPNLGTGGENAHGIYEFLPVKALDKMVEVLKEIVRA